MRVPARLEPLMDQGILDEVIRPLMSGKEADVFLVMSEGQLRVAKVYKEATQRSFKHRAEYTEGRKVRNTRQQRAMAKSTKFGREQNEEAWRSAEVDAIYRLRAAGVRTPKPYHFVEGVLVMELITGEDGQPAPRLIDVELEKDEAKALFRTLLRDIVRMLCAGLVHGDLSDFNVLLAPDGPVIIDFPQAVDAAHNRNAKKLLIRDVNNITSFLARFVPRLAGKRYGDEMWALYEGNRLTPETRLTGEFRGSTHKADTSSLLEEIEAAERESRARRSALGLDPAPPARTPRFTEKPAPRPAGKQPAGQPSRAPGKPSGKAPRPPAQAPRPPAQAARPPKPARPTAAQVEAADVDDLDRLLIIAD